MNARGTLVLVTEVIIFGFALWLGLYLIARNPANPRLRFTGLGLVVYALGLASDLLARSAPTPDMAMIITRLRWALLVLPALCWSGAAVYLVPEELPLRDRLARVWRSGLLPGVLLVVLLLLGTDLIFDGSRGDLRPRAGHLVVAAAGLLPALVALLAVGWSVRLVPKGRPLGVLLVMTIFFGLGIALLAIPLDWLPRALVLFLVGGDLVLLGVGIAVLDAFEEGENLLRDCLRAFDVALFAALLFGGMVALTIILGTGPTFAMLALLLATVATAIALQTFNDQFQSALDRIAFARVPHLRRARTSLRATASALPRVNESLDLETLDDAEFVRLTRRALSHFGDLPRLATSPLTRLPLVEARLQQRGVQGDTLERAAELKALLAETIARFKPRDAGDFGTSDEWRYYNALYFPYVAGLKPYSRRADHNGRDPTAQAALEWFRTNVPERTLHNWQNAAAKLVAQDLRERIEREIPSRSS